MCASFSLFSDIALTFSGNLAGHTNLCLSLEAVSRSQWYTSQRQRKNRSLLHYGRRSDKAWKSKGKTVGTWEKLRFFAPSIGIISLLEGDIYVVDIFHRIIFINELSSKMESPKKLLHINMLVKREAKVMGELSNHLFVSLSFLSWNPTNSLSPLIARLRLKKLGGQWRVERCTFCDGDCAKIASLLVNKSHKITRSLLAWTI